jgi:hypothetical protein
MKVTNMNKNKSFVLLTLSLAVSVFFLMSCEREAVDQPTPAGPSSFATLLYLTANPNVLHATSMDRAETTITATLKKFEGTVLSGRTIYFEIVDNVGTRLDLGYFEGHVTVKRLDTDGSGIINVAYYGPLSSEIAQNGTYYIRATVAGCGSEIISEKTPVYVVRDPD